MSDFSFLDEQPVSKVAPRAVIRKPPKRSDPTPWIIAGVATVALLGAGGWIVATQLGSKAEAKSQESEESKKSSAGPEKPAPATAKKTTHPDEAALELIGTVQLCDEFRANAVAAGHRRDGSYVAIKGTVICVDKFADGQSYVAFAGDEDSDVKVVLCVMANEKWLDEFKRGEVIAVAGKVDGLAHDRGTNGVVLLDCWIPSQKRFFTEADAGLRPIQPETQTPAPITAPHGDGDPKSLPVETAAALYTAYQSNAVAADSFYKDRLIAISGEIKSIGSGSKGPIVSLSVGAQSDIYVVSCVFDDASKAVPLTDFRAGQKVTIAGTVTGVIGGFVIVRYCWIPAPEDLNKR